MESLSLQVVSAAKLPILNPNEFDLWKMRIKQYFLITDYSLWEVIINGDSPIPTRVIDGVAQPAAPTTAEQRLARKNELKARGTLLMALPDKHQLKFNIHKDAKTLMEAIEKQFGGNEETKKRNKTDLEDQSLDDLFNSLKIYEVEVKSSSTTSPTTQNIAFVTSQNTDNTNESVSDVASVFAASTKVLVSALPNVDTLSDAMAMLTMRARRFLQRTGRNLGANGTTLTGFDMSKEEIWQAKHERDELKLKLDKFQTSSKNLSQLLTSQTNDKTGLGYDNQVFNRSVFDCDEMFSSKSDVSMPTSLLCDRYKSGEWYHDVPPPYIGTFMPPKPDLVFHDAPIVNETVPTVFNVEPSTTKPTQDLPSVKTFEHPIPAANLKTYIPKSKGHGNSWNRKACFVCKCLTHLIKDFDYYEKKMVQKPIGNHAIRVLTRSRLVPLSAARPINTVVPQTKVQHQRPAKNGVHKLHSPQRRPINRRSSPPASNFHQKVTAAKVPQVNAVKGVKGNWGNTQHVFKDKRVIDNGCSRHMIGNMSYLIDFKEINGGYVAFGGNPKGGKITCKGKIRTGKLDFDDVYFVKELKFNLFSVSQMCDKKNSVLFTDTKCIVLSPDFKLPDENQVLLRVPKENNMYNVDLKNIIPSGDLTCLFANATLDESNLWHRRLIAGFPPFLLRQAKRNEKPGTIRIKKEFSVARTPQQNGIAERKNRTLIEAARTMLADSLLPIPFWAEAVNTACYVQNRVLVTKPHNKTPYELLLGRTSSIGFMRPFGCPVTILNTLDPLGKFDGKADEGFLIGYSISSKAFRVFNSIIRIVQETLHINFLENQPNVAGSSPTWLFDIDILTKCMNYQPVLAGNQPNPSAGIQEHFDADKAGEGNVQQYVIFPLWSSSSKDPLNTNDDTTFEVKEPESAVHVSPSSSAKSKKHDDKTKREAKGKSLVDTPVSAGGQISTNSTNTFSAAGPSNTAVSPTLGKSSYVDPSQYPNDADMPALEDITYSDAEEDVVADADFLNLETNITVTPQTRSMTRMVKEQGGLTQINNDNFHTCMFSCFLSQEEPKRVHQDLKDPYWIKAMQEELLQFKMQKDERGIVIRNIARLVGQGHTQEEGIYYEEVFAPVAWIEAIRLFLAYASFMGFMVYQMDVKSAFLYGTIKEEVYVCQPSGFEDPDYPDKVYKVVKALYGLHQAPRAWYETLANYLLENHFQKGKIDQTLFIKKQKDEKSASTPIDSEKPLLKDHDGEDVDVHTYRSMISSLMYLTSSRPDIMFAICACARFQVTPKASHLYAVKRIFRFRLISWQCKKQTVVATSSIEAEYVAAASCCAQVLWIQNQLLNYGRKVIITKDIVRQALHLDDAESIDFLPNGEIFAELCMSAKRNVDSSLKFYMYPRFLQLMISAQVGDLTTHTIKYTSPALTQKVFANMRRVWVADDVIADVIAHATAKLTLPSPTSTTTPPPLQELPSTSQVAPTPPPSPIAQPSSPPPQQQPLHDAGILMDLLNTLLETYTTLTRKVEALEQDKIAQALEITKLKQRVRRLEKKRKLRVSGLKRLKKMQIRMSSWRKLMLLKMLKLLRMQMDDEPDPAKLKEVIKAVTTTRLMTEVVTAAATIITAAPITATTITAAPSPVRKRKGVVIRDPEETATPSTIVHSEPKSKDKGKGILVEEPKPLKKQAQIEKDEAYARELEAELNKNINWDDVIEQARKNMMVYLKNMAGFKMDFFKGMSYDDIRPIFENHFNSVVGFLEKSEKELEEEASRALKRKTKSSEQQAAKKQKMDEEVKELKKHLQIVTNDEDDVYTEATPLALKEPILAEVNTQELIMAEEFSVEDVVIEDYVSSGEDGKDVEQGNGQEDESAPTDGHFFYDEEGIDTAYETKYDVQSSKDAGTDDDDSGTSMDLPFDNIGNSNLVSDDVLEGKDVDVINADGFETGPGNDKERNYSKRRLAKLRTNMEGVINASGTGPIGLNSGMEAEPRGSSVPTSRSKKRKNTSTNDDSQVSPSFLDAHDKGDLCSWVLAYKRDLLGLDGAFMKGPFPGQVLVAIGLDSNNGIYLLAYALVEAETKSSWCWFLKCLGRAKSDLLLNNICEVFNGKIVRGKDKPVITLLEYIREYCMKKIMNVQGVIDKCTGPLTPTATRIMKSIKKEAHLMKVQWNGANKYQVSGSLGDQCVVDVVSMTCSCRKWELTRIPCKHPVAACWNMAINNRAAPPPKPWVNPCYRLSTWKETYSPKIQPICGTKYWEKSTCPTTLLPPKHHERKNHYMSIMQKNGHNKATCKGQGGNNAEGSGSAFRQAQQTEPAVGQDGSGGPGAGVVIGLSATAGEGGAGDPGGAGVSNQCSSHTRWTRRIVQTERISQQKRTLTQPVSQPSTSFEVPVSQTRNTDGREMGDGVPTQSSTAVPEIVTERSLSVTVRSPSAFRGLGGGGYLRDYVRIVVGKDDEDMPSEAVEQRMDATVLDEIDGAKGEQVLNHVVKKGNLEFMVCKEVANPGVNELVDKGRPLKSKWVYAE
nr:hypothetical protein [Tanacetum cinerariifolium]